MARRRRPREWHTRTAATLLSLAFSRSTTEGLLTSSSNAFAKNAGSRSVQHHQQEHHHHCSIPSNSNRIALSAVSPGGRRGARVWRLEAARYGAAGGDDEGAAAAAARNTRLIQAAAAAAAGNAATEKAMPEKAMPAAPADGGQQQQGQDQDRDVGKKRAMLRRMRRRAKAKIKAIPARVLDSSPGGRRAETSRVKNAPRALIGFGGNSGSGSGSSSHSKGVEGAADSGGEGRGGRRRRRRGWGAGAVGSAVFGTPASFVRRKVAACKSFVTSRERVHWASLAMATYIFTTSVVPRLPAGT